jgi:UDP-N-acetylglucosamine--N-acetylmuramyl-(pentapeptide) pyrophosphoryl-undecaprenol N-acetylglucosamine transferase
VPKVLYGISSIGLGHATRSMVIIEELSRRGAEVKAFSGGKAADYIRANGWEVEKVLVDAAPRVRALEMSHVTQWYVRAWLAQWRNVKRAEALLDSYSPDVVVCDEEFSGMAAAEKAGKKRVFISDELALGFARGWLASRIEARVARWYQRLQGSVELLLVPEKGVDQGNRRYVGPVVRQVTMTPSEVRKKYDIPEGRLVLFSMSGSGVGSELGRRLAEVMEGDDFGDVTFVVTGNRGAKFDGKVRDLGVVPDNQNLVACADLVVSTAGKSTIDEAASAGTPLVVVPIRYHAEQVRNAAAIGFRYEDIERLPELVKERIGKRAPPVFYDGEKRAAGAILSLVSTSSNQKGP